MNRVNKDELLNAVKKTYNACIENSKFESEMAISLCFSEKECYVYAENRLISIKSFFKTEELKNTFTCIVKGKDLLNILKCAKEDSVNLELMQKENKLFISSGDAKVYLYTNAIKTFSKESLSLEIEGKCYADLSKLKEIKHNISSNSDSRLRSVHLLVGPNGTKLETTDGLNYSIRGKDRGTEFVIEEKFLEIITEIAEDERIIFFYGKYKNGTDGILIKTNDTEIKLPLEVRKYFSLNPWIFDKDKVPQGMGTIKLDRFELINALNLMGTIADYVEIDIKNNEPLNIKSIGVYGESETLVDANIQGLWQETVASFNIKAMLDSLTSINDKEINLYIKSKSSGIHIIGDDYYEYLGAVS